MKGHREPLFIAEASSNHDRDLDRALAFVDAAADAGCDAVKFQLFKIDRMFAPEILAKSAKHRARKEWELPVAHLKPIAARCAERNILFSCTPFYLDAVAELAPYVAALGKRLPTPPPNAAGPFALSAAGALEALVGKSGLTPERAATVTTVMSFPDEPYAIRGLLASGVAERAMRHSGEEAVARSVSEAISPFRQRDGSYRFSNEWRFLVSRA